MTNEELLSIAENDLLKHTLAEHAELERRVAEVVAYTHRNGHSGVNATTQEHLAEVRRILEATPTNSGIEHGGHV